MTTKFDKKREIWLHITHYLKICREKVVEKDLTIAKLKESLEKDYGDFGRTQYVIEKLQKDLPFPKSDHLYIERMIKLCEPINEEPNPEEVLEFVSSPDLVKCHLCDLQIDLDEKSVMKKNFWFHDEKSVMKKNFWFHDEKSVMKKNFWFHDKCFEKIPILKTEVSQKIKTSPEVTMQHVIVKSKSLRPQMAFSGGLLASLIGTTYFLAGDLIAILVGIWGSVLYIGIFGSQIIPKKKPVANN
ncbi:MAG: hypothetical protein QQN55_00390 [Nitrosopumilus sp.]